MSLKLALNQILKNHSPQTMTLAELEAYCKLSGYKLSNAERRLRPSESPNIERVFKNGAIIGYRWKQSDVVTNFFRDFPKVEPIKTGQGVLL